MFCVEDRASRRLDRAKQTPITLIAPVNGAFGRSGFAVGVSGDASDGDCAADRVDAVDSDVV